MDCKQWLVEFIPAGTFKDCDQVRQKAKGEGFSKGELTAARKELDIATFSFGGTDYAEAPQRWFWARLEKMKEV